jgi:Domain of unknown function (DUF5130)
VEVPVAAGKQAPAGRPAAELTEEPRAGLAGGGAVPAGQSGEPARAEDLPVGLGADRLPVRTVDLPEGTAVMPHGRVSAAREVRVDPTKGPFTRVQLCQLDEALTLASRGSGLKFSVYLGPLGPLGPRSRDAAEALHATGPDPRNAVLIAVSPGERVVEVVTGEQSCRRLTDNGCRLAVMAMVASFKEGDLVGGLVSGLRMMANQAGEPPRRPR